MNVKVSPWVAWIPEICLFKHNFLFCAQSSAGFQSKTITLKQVRDNFTWTKIDQHWVIEMVSKCQDTRLSAALESTVHLQVLYVSGQTLRVRPDLLFKIKLSILWNPSRGYFFFLSQFSAVLLLPDNAVDSLQFKKCHSAVELTNSKQGPVFTWIFKRISDCS